MIHVAAPAPDNFSADHLRDELNAVHPGCISVSGYGDQVVAIYDADDLCPSATEWSLVVSNHTPPAVLADTPLRVLAQAIIDAASIDDLRDAAQAILQSDA